METKPLFRKVNTRARGVHHLKGSNFRHGRNTKAQRQSDVARGSMHQGKLRGLDYTPLFKFLLSKVGADWNRVYEQARPRLNAEEPIYWLVARSSPEMRPYVRIGESSYYSGMYIDEHNRLQLVDATLTAAGLTRQCTCCTHTFNGVPFAEEAHHMAARGR